MYQSGSNLESVNPDLTADVMARVDEIIDRYKGKPGCLIPVLEGCQVVVDYLPMELLEYISNRLNIPGSTVFGVVTFYSFFTMVPKGRHTIKVCMGTACYVRGIAEVQNRLQSELNVKVGGTTEDRNFSLEAVRCLGACGLAPVMVVDGVTHGAVSPESALKIVDKYK